MPLRAPLTGSRPRVAVTRHLPEPVERRMGELFDCVLNPEDRRLSRDELVARMRDCDVLVPTVTDRIDAAMLAEAGDRLRLIANFGSGMDPVIESTGSSFLDKKSFLVAFEEVINQEEKSQKRRKELDQLLTWVYFHQVAKVFRARLRLHPP